MAHFKSEEHQAEQQRIIAAIEEWEGISSEGKQSKLRKFALVLVEPAGITQDIARYSSRTEYTCRK